MRIIVNASGRAIVSASGRVAESGASTPTYAATITGVTLTPNTATQAAAGTGIGTLSIQSTGATLVNPVITMTSSAGGDFALSGNTVSFLPNGVPAGSYTIGLRVAVDNAATWTGTETVTITSSGGGGGTFSFPIVFTGTAGTIPADAANTGGLTVDGSGNLVLPTSTYGSTIFTAPGALSDGTVDWVFAAGNTDVLIDCLFRSSIDGSNRYTLIVNADGSVLLGKNTAGNFSSVESPTPAGVVSSSTTSIGVHTNGATMTLRVNGADTSHSWTDSSYANGYIGIGVQTDYAAKVASINSTMPPSPSISLITPSYMSIGVSGTIYGTFTSGVSSSNLQYSLDNSTWAALPSGAVVSGSAFHFPLTLSAINNNQRVYVRDSTQTYISGLTGAFSCNSAPAYTTIPISGTLPSSIRLGLMAHGASPSSVYHTSRPGFAKGHFNPNTHRLLGQIGAGSPFEIYVDGIKSWSDGTVRTCRVSAPIASSFADGVETVINVTIDNNPPATGHLTTAAALVAAHDWHVKHYGGQCGSDVFVVSLRDIVTNFMQDSWGRNPLGGWDVFADNPGELGVHGWSYWKRADGAFDAWRKTDIWVSQRSDGTFEMLAQVKQSNYDIPHPLATANTSTEHSLVCFHELYQDTTLVGAWGGPNDNSTPIATGLGTATLPASDFDVSANAVSALNNRYGSPVFFSPASGGTLPSGIAAGTPYYSSNGTLYNQRGIMSGSQSGSPITFGSAGSGNITVTSAFGTYNGSSLILAAPDGYPYLIGASRVQITTAWDEVYMSKWATLFPSYAQPSDTTFQLTRYGSAAITDWSGFSQFVPNSPPLGFWLNITGDNPGDPRIGFLAMRNVVSYLVPHDTGYDKTARIEGLGWGDEAMWWDDVSSGRVLNFSNTSLAGMGPPRPNSGFNYNGGDASIGNGYGADNSGYYDGYGGCMLSPTHMPAPWVVPLHHTGHPVYLQMGVHQSVTSGLLADGVSANPTINGVTYYGAMSPNDAGRGHAWVMRVWDFNDSFVPDEMPESAYVSLIMDTIARFWRDYTDDRMVNNPSWFNLGLILPDDHYTNTNPNFQGYMTAMSYMVLGFIAAHRERDYNNILSAAGNFVINLLDDAGTSPQSLSTYILYDGFSYNWRITDDSGTVYPNLLALAQNGASESYSGIGSPPFPTTGLAVAWNTNHTGPESPTFYTNGGFPWSTGGDYPIIFRCALAMAAGLGVVSYHGGQAVRAHAEWVTRMTTSPCTGIKFSDVGNDGSLGNAGVPHMYPTWALMPISYP